MSIKAISVPTTGNNYAYACCNGLLSLAKDAKPLTPNYTFTTYLTDISTTKEITS